MSHGGMADLVNAGKSDKLTNIHYNDKLGESPDLFTTSFASGGDL